MPRKTEEKGKTVEELAQDWGVDFQKIRIKGELVDTIREHCRKHKISQRNLASRVPGLTHDRVSRIFRGEVGHMTIDKLITILSCIGYAVDVKARAA